MAYNDADKAAIEAGAGLRFVSGRSHSLSLLVHGPRPSRLAALPREQWPSSAPASSSPASCRRHRMLGTESSVTSGSGREAR